MTSRERILNAMNHGPVDRSPVDFGGQKGPLIFPDTYREFSTPYHLKMWRRVKEL